MRSWRDAVIVCAIAGCGATPVELSVDAPAVDAAATCQTSYLTYDDFGAPFVASWCRGCHSAQLPPDMRQGSPMDINFDSVDDIRQLSARMIVRACAAPPTMPPRGGPSDDDRARLAEWLNCGAP
jgi:uncharacterized membrane protein